MKTFFELIGTLNFFKFKGNPLKDGFTPYVDAACNRRYNMLFCDKLDVFRDEFRAQQMGAWSALLSKRPYPAALRAIADDHEHASRLRLLAYHRLREMRQPIARKQLLGVVVEVGSDAGLDVLAAYRDGRVQRIDNRETMRAFEPVQQSFESFIETLLSAAQVAVDRIGPWLRPRVAPPTAGMIRMSFLVSDGLYFGQGWLDAMREDALANPIILASDALRRVVDSDSAEK